MGDGKTMLYYPHSRISLNCMLLCVIKCRDSNSEYILFFIWYSISDANVNPRLINNNPRCPCIINHSSDLVTFWFKILIHVSDRHISAMKIDSTVLLVE